MDGTNDSYEQLRIPVVNQPKAPFPSSSQNKNGLELELKKLNRYAPFESSNMNPTDGVDLPGDIPERFRAAATIGMAHGNG